MFQSPACRSAPFHVFAGISDHRGWAIVVTVAPPGHAVERRWIALIDDGLEPQPLHHPEPNATLSEAVTHALLRAPGKELGPPWREEHRVALAAALAVVDARSPRVFVSGDRGHAETSTRNLRTNT